MKKNIVIFLLILLFSRGLFSETFFLYSFEIYDEAQVSIGDSVREGVMDALFEAGHIIIDDISLTKEALGLADQLDVARKTGAGYLISVKVNSVKLDGKGEKIRSSAFYSLYDVKYERLLGRGELNRNNIDGKMLLSKTKFWFNLGMELSVEIEKTYTNRNNKKISGGDKNIKPEKKIKSEG